MLTRPLKILSQQQHTELSEFPSDPVIGMPAFRGGIYYIYSVIDGLSMWCPLSKMPSAHVHSQGLASPSWTVHHNLNTDDLVVVVYDLTGKVLPAVISHSKIDGEWITFITHVLSAVGYAYIFGLDNVNVSNINATNVVVEDSLTVNGVSIPLTPEDIHRLLLLNIDTHILTDSLLAHLVTIEAGAQVNPSSADIKTGYENNTDTNVFTDDEKLKLLNIDDVVVSPLTAEELLALLVTVDGIDSGLDAELFSGNTVSYFAVQSTTYTKVEVQSLLTDVINNRVWKAAVATFDDLATVYPAPVEGWTASVNDTNILYRYDGTLWENIASGLLPLATDTVDGKMSSDDYTKLSTIETNAEVNRTAAEIKIAYESNLDTNALTDERADRIDDIPSWIYRIGNRPFDRGLF